MYGFMTSSSVRAGLRPHLEARRKARPAASGRCLISGPASVLGPLAWLARPMNRMPGPRELADLPYADALTPHEGALATHAAYDPGRFARVTFAAAAPSGSRFLDRPFTA